MIEPSAISIWRIITDDYPASCVLSRPPWAVAAAQYGGTLSPERIAGRQSSAGEPRGDEQFAERARRSFAGDGGSLRKGFRRVGGDAAEDAGGFRSGAS